MNKPVLTYVYDTAESTSFRDLDDVRVLRDVTTIEGENFAAGSIGTIVAIWGGGSAYVVEFDGARQSIATVPVEDLEHVVAGDAVSRLSPASGCLRRQTARPT